VSAPSTTLCPLHMSDDGTQASPPYGSPVNAPGNSLASGKAYGAARTGDSHISKASVFSPSGAWFVWQWRSKSANRLKALSGQL